MEYFQFDPLVMAWQLGILLLHAILLVFAIKMLLQENNFTWPTKLFIIIFFLILPVLGPGIGLLILKSRKANVQV